MTSAIRFMQWPWYPLALAAALVLIIFVRDDVSLLAVPRPLGVAIGMTLCLLIGARILFGSIHRAGVAAAITLLLLRLEHIEEVAIALVGLAATSAVLLLLVRRRKGQLRSAALTPRANLLTSVLLLVLLVNAVSNGTIAGAATDLSSSGPLGRPVDAGVPPNGAPDIHILMLDGYPRQDTLARLFEFDNSAFAEELADRGLRIAGQSRSNYMYTAQTLAATFQMRHVTTFQPHRGADVSLRQLINDNPTFDLARTNGYSVVANVAPWERVAVRSADVTCGDGLATELETHLLGRSILAKAIHGVNDRLLGSGRLRTYVDTAFSCFTTDSPSPQLVFAHVPVPHLPIVFDRYGDPAAAAVVAGGVSDLAVPFERFRNAYIDQLEYLNERIVDAIDQILSTNADAVLIVFSDHGPETHLREHYGDQRDLDERFANLFAARTPGHECLFGDAATPINIFPRLFNAYLNEALRLSADLQYATDTVNGLSLTPYSTLGQPDADPPRCPADE